MEIIKKYRYRAVKFTCFHCWCEFKEERNKCMTTERTTLVNCDVYGDYVDRDYKTTKYYLCPCPECGKMVETSEEEYSEQCSKEYEAEQKEAEQKRVEAIIQQNMERRVERLLKDTESRRWHKVIDESQIIGDWEWYIFQVIDQENKNKEKVRQWDVFKQDLEFYKKHPLHNIDFDAHVIKWTESAKRDLTVRCKMLGITLEYALAHRTEEFPLTLDHTIFDPFTDGMTDQEFAHQYYLGNIRK